MPIGDRLGNLRQLLPGARPRTEDERLLKLYWNRAELKKEFSNLRDERHALVEELKKQEGALARAREELAELESHLANPDVAYAAITYYQLRALWRECAERLQRFAGELRAQQEERERRRSLIEFDQQRRRKLASIDRQLLESQSSADTLEAQLKLLQTRLEAARGFWHYFRRRKLLDTIAEQQARWESTNAQVEELTAARGAADAAESPGFAGLSVEGRRVVNVATIAYAQHLFTRLSGGDLALLARETTVRRVIDVSYGTVQDCERIMQRVRTARDALGEGRENLAELKERTDRLRSNAAYRSDADTVPMPDSIGMMPGPAAPVTGLETASRTGGINVLVDDYWDIYRALTH
jgi:hypothetical protein